MAMPPPRVRPTARRQTLFDLTRAVAAGESLDTIYGVALDCLESGTGVHRCAVLTTDDRGVMRFRAWHGLSDDYRSRVEGHSPWGPDVVDPAPVLVPDVRAEPSLAELRPAIEAEGICAIAFIPLAVGGSLLGKFMLYDGEARAFRPQEIAFAQAIGNHVALAIDQHRARDERALADAIFRSSDTGIARIDNTGRIGSFNDRFCEIVGRPREEVAALNGFVELIHTGDRIALLECLDGVRIHAAHANIEMRLRLTAGPETWVSASISPVAPTAGPTAAAILLLTDVTARKAAEQAVHDSEVRYRTLVEGLSVAVYTTDRGGRITLCNAAAVRLWGREPEIGKDLWCGSWRIFWPDGNPMELDECPMSIALRERRAVRDVEIVVERPDGTRVNVLPYPTPLFASTGELVGAVNVLVDITEQGRMQEALRAALRSKDDFLGEISHELRNPITQIVGFAELLHSRWEQLDADTQGESIGEIHEQAQRLGRLVENMLVLSRLERGMAAATEPQLVQRILPLTLEKFRQRHPRTTLHKDIPDDLPPVESNAGTIDQVIWNLLSNAQKYGPTTGPVELFARAVDGNVEIVVADHGPGIPEEDIPHIFEPYVRSSATSGTVPGLGLGLSVCARLAQAEGATLWARNRSPGLEIGLRLPTTRDNG